MQKTKTEAKNMWNHKRSITLTHTLVRAFYVILAAAAAALPFLQFIHNKKIIFAVFYLAVPAGLIALICLDKVLQKIKKGIVFEHGNIKNLRIFSWCCFYAAADGLVFAVLAGLTASGNKDTVIIYNVVPLIRCSVAAVFTGLVVRVVKNIIEEAVALKEENELTI